MLIEVAACGVCRTDLHVVDGELPAPEAAADSRPRDRRPRRGARRRVSRASRVGERVGVPWLGWTCGTCPYCRAGRENLCDHARFTGYQIDGGYAEYTVADARYCFPLPDGYSDAEAAPLLCAGLIGYRALSWRATPAAPRPLRLRRGRAYHRAGRAPRRAARSTPSRGPATRKAQQFARELGAVWAGGSDATPPEPLDAAIIFAPVGALVPAALQRRAQGRRGGLRRHPHERHPGFPYDLLWEERVRPLGRQPHAATTRASFSRSRPRCRSRPRSCRCRLRRPTRRSSACAEGELTGAAVLIP